MSTATIAADFTADLNAFALDALSASGYPAPSRGEAWAPLYAYANLRRRMVDPQPRAVVESTALASRVLLPELRAGVDRLTTVMERGDDLRPYQSKLVAKSATYQDQLLNDWGIQHFHLGTLKRTATHCDRTGELLFAWIEPERVLLVDVLDHGSFEEQEILEIIHVEWPEVLRRFHMPMITDVRPDYRGEERRQLRRAGVMMMTKLSDGTVLMPPGGGISTAATGTADTTAVHSWLREVRALEARCRDEIDAIRAAIEQAKGVAPDHLALKLHVTDTGLAVEETSTGLVFRMGE